MPINIDVDAYVHYYLQDFQINGGFLQSEAYFLNKFNVAVSKMKADAFENQLTALMNANRDIDQQTLREAMSLGTELSEGTLLEETLNSLAESINNSIEKAYNGTDITQLMVGLGQKLHSFNDLFSKGIPEIHRLNKFFETLVEVFNQLNGYYSKKLLRILKQFGIDIMGKNVSFGQDVWSNAKNVDILSKDELIQLSKIQEYLTNAANAFKKNNNQLSTRSFSSTINNIFSTILGEGWAVSTLSSIVSNSLNEFENALAAIPNMCSEVSPGGTGKDIQGTVSKVDVFSNDAFSMSLEQYGYNLKINIGSNLSVKTYSTYKESTNIHIVSGSPLGKYISQMPIIGQYYTYNTIVHNDEAGSANAFRTLRAAYAATFFNEWLSGSGQMMEGGLNINTAQFLMVNGRVYSIMSIVRNVCNKLLGIDDFESANMPIHLHISKINNAWSANQSKGPNWVDARIRSEAVKAVINQLIISVDFNAGILFELAQI